MATLTSYLKTILSSSREAAFLGETQSDNLSAAGTTQGTGTPITASINNFTTVTAAAAATTLPLISQTYYAEIFIRNSDSADTLSVFPNVGDSINALGANTAITITAGNSLIFKQVSSTKWVTR